MKQYYQIKGIVLTFFTLTIVLSFSIFAFAQNGGKIQFSFSKVIGIGSFPTGGAVQQIIPVGNHNDFAYNFAPAGMSLPFAGNTYSRVIISTNGWIALTNAATIPASISSAGYLNNNQLSINTTGLPIIAPYWDDLSTSLIAYNYAAPDLWIQWTCRIDNTNMVAANNFWIKIDGNTGDINFYYSNNSGYVVAGPPTASIGISGECPGEYYSYDLVSNYADSTIETNTISTKVNNETFIWTALSTSFVPCSPTDVFDMTSEKSFSIHPNPTKDHVEISYPLLNRSDVKIEIYNSIGKKIKTENIKDQSIGSHKHFLSLKDIQSNGIYFISLTTGESCITKRLILHK